MLSILAVAAILAPQDANKTVIDSLRNKGLSELGAYSMLDELTSKIGARVSGSPEAARAVIWVGDKLKSIGATNVSQIACMVPHWTRGKGEYATMAEHWKLSICSLGGSVPTPHAGVEGEVVEVHSLKEAEALGAKAKGKIVFYNRGFDPTLPNTFAAYGGAVDQRTSGATVAAKNGAVAVLVRSMTLAKDDAPHTGAMRYGDGPQIPAAALGIQSADKLSEAIKHGPVKVKLVLNCKTLPDEPSANVIGEIKGSQYPDEVIAMGGHLDSWDLGRGAHDDGAGVTQAMEALRLIKELGLRPKRTIRVVAWMNEENGGRGAKAYADYAAKATEKHFAAMESDSGGFMPRAFGVSEDKLSKVADWLPYLSDFGIERFVAGGGDADNGPLAAVGAVLFALHPENQRYFDYHHSRNDTIDKVNPRELEMGALSMASLAWLISEDGDRLK
ncbi:MAG: M20/M25/M40 family metallo-hydrolase [Armatimonadetes bacterium]|nr:M20/M25/M40 family metallo-hydrolase [Armatimonadota bacterium]